MHEELKAIAERIAKAKPDWYKLANVMLAGVRISEYVDAKGKPVGDPIIEAIPDLTVAATIGALWVTYCPRSELVHHVAGRWQVWLEASDSSDPLRDNSPFVVHPDRATAMMLAVAAKLEAANAG